MLYEILSSQKVNCSSKSVANMNFREVYHSSKTLGLKQIIPHKSTHGKSWVYATKDIVMSAVFLGDLGGDFTCAVGRDPETGKPFICERFKEAFNLRYDEVKGSIYVLPGERFIDAKTQWEEEVVSEETVVPLREIQVNNAKEYLLRLAEEQKLIIKYYPEKIAGIPRDDEDIVYRAAIWSRQFGNKTLEQVKKYHPNLLDRVLRAIQENKY
jgi:hypothetical protein